MQYQYLEEAFLDRLFADLTEELHIAIERAYI
jgi:hypothetical protein